MFKRKLPFIVAAGCFSLTSFITTSPVFGQEYAEVSSDQTVSKDFFYDRLQDDGAWIQSDDYGYIWQPTVARNERDWKPYTNGRWSYSDRGWTWISEEPFGWATYHYGRWVNLDETGWCWVPGTTWAPAWVSWRSNDRYLGWAPLPPEARLRRGGRIEASVDVGFDIGPAFFSFIAYEDVGERDYRSRYVPRDRNVTIINETTDVTNIVYNNVQVNNYGPSYDVVTQRSRQPVDNYRIETNRDLKRGDYRVSQPRDGVLPVFAPNFQDNGKPGKNVKPQKVDRKVSGAQRDQGWKGYDPEQVRQTKAAIKARQKAAPAQEAIQGKKQEVVDQPNRGKNQPKGPKDQADNQRDNQPPAVNPSDRVTPKNPDKKSPKEITAKNEGNAPRQQPAPENVKPPQSDKKSAAKGKDQNTVRKDQPNRPQEAPAPKKHATQPSKPSPEAVAPKQKHPVTKDAPAPRKQAPQAPKQVREPAQPKKQPAKVVPSSKPAPAPENAKGDNKKGKKKSDKTDENPN